MANLSQGSAIHCKPAIVLFALFALSAGLLVICLLPRRPVTVEPWRPVTVEPWRPVTVEPWRPVTVEPWRREPVEALGGPQHRERLGCDESQQAGPVRMVVLVKTGAVHAHRRKVVRANWLNSCSIGKLHARAQAGDRAGYDFYEQQQAMGAEYYRVRGHRFEYGDRRLEVSCMFVTGLSGKDLEARMSLHSEMREYGDLLLPEIADAYNIMTMKTMWMIVWSLANLQYEYVLLIDDDATVVWDNLVPLVLNSSRTSLYGGHLHPALGVIHCESLYRVKDLGTRKEVKKNCVTWQQYNSTEYPPFASGFAYFLSRDAAATVSLTGVASVVGGGSIPGNVEDAMTGVMADRAHINLTSYPAFLHWDLDHVRKLCKEEVPFAVVGNAPRSVLDRVTANAISGKPLCADLPISGLTQV